jgi:hypothetical protein
MIMDEDYTLEDWNNFEKRVLDDPKRSSEWADRILAGQAWPTRTKRWN